MMANRFANVGRLTRMNLRRDWLKIVVWIAVLAGMMAGAAGKFDSLYGSKASMNSIVTTLKTPAMVSLLGPFTANKPYTVAVIYGAEMVVFMGLIAAMMNIYFAIHATRSEEDDGVTEYVLAHGVGRQSPLLASVGELVFINLVAGVIEVIGIQAASMSGTTANGSWLFGIGLAAFGFMFGMVSLLTAQIFNNARSATIWSYLVLGITFVARMVTDIQNPDYTWWTVYGWIEKLNLYNGNNWGPVLLILAMSIVILAVTVGISATRDIGAGLIAQRDGRNKASVFLRGPLTLLMRIDRVSFAVWFASLFVLGAMYGSIFGTIGNLMKTNPTIAQLLSSGAVSSANRAIVMSFANKLSLVFAVVATIPILITIFRINGDERKGYLEMMHAKPISRGKMFFSYSIHAMVVGTGTLFLAVLGMAVVGNASMKSPVLVSRFLRSFIAFWPAILIAGGVAALLVALWPRIQTVAWIVPVYGIFSLYFGPLVKLPKSLQQVSPYGWINNVPTKQIQWDTFWWMTLLGMVLFIIGYLVYRHRDLIEN
ncbi:ABC transporter permease [Paucilactobacillus suebicus]|nr:ABC transporter permease [Paucilactobacillus suebicus]